MIGGGKMSEEDMRERLAWMADSERDLTLSDRASIKWALERIEKLEAVADALTGEITGPVSTEDFIRISRIIDVVLDRIRINGQGHLASVSSDLMLANMTALGAMMVLEERKKRGA